MIESPALPAMSPPFDAWRAGAIGLDVNAVSAGTRAGLRARQTRRLAALLRFAAEHSLLCRERFGKSLDRIAPGAQGLRELPVITKAELMQRFDECVTDRRLRLDALRGFTADPSNIGQAGHGGYFAWESSGSSGEPALFVHDALSMAVYDALEALRRPALRPLQRWLDPWYMGERTAFVGATNRHFASVVSVERLRRLNPYSAVNTRSFSFLQPVRELTAQLQRHAPTIIATYPTCALLLAEEAAAGRLRIQPREIWTGGEALSPSARRFIGATFGCPVSNSYGASEFLALGFECSSGLMHLNSDWAILESVDESHRPVPDGVPGRTTLLTNLANRVLPLVRYDLGDRVVLHHAPCACGSPLPTIEVEGRTDDSLVLHDARGRSVRLPPMALTTVLEEEAGVFDFQLAQQGDGLLLRIGFEGTAGENALRQGRSALAAYLQRQGLPQVHIDARCEPGVRGRSGKVQRVVAAEVH